MKENAVAATQPINSMPALHQHQTRQAAASLSNLTRKTTLGNLAQRSALPNKNNLAYVRGTVR